MDVTTSLGLSTGLVTTDEALSTDWSARSGPEVVRVVDPPGEAWPDLRRAGFTVHPAWVTWTATVPPTAAEYLARLGKKERQRMRTAERLMVERGLSLKVVTPMDAESFDAFLALYEPQIGAMRHGVAFAGQDRPSILAEAADYFCVQAWSADVLVGATVCRLRRDAGTVVVRFTATDPESRRAGLVRALYMRVFQVAREMGFGTISLGSDPALYGHITEPGLFAFKNALRFTAVPSRLAGTMEDPDEATLVLRPGPLRDPSLLVSYPPDARGGVGLDTPLWLTVLTSEPGAAAEVRAPFVAGTRTVHIR